VLQLTEKQIRNFFAKIAKGNEDECWPWLGSTRGGYGRLTLNTKSYNATEILLFLEGEIRQSSQQALHSCDNRGCCNPNHVSYGTASQNALDRANRNTDWYVRRWKNLTSEQEALIRDLHAIGGSFATV
jgi:hypothetical protein